MLNDPDLVRIDLLRCKRKLFLSYPENSKERADFLTASKLSELGYLSRLVPPDVIDLVFQEYNNMLKEEIIIIGSFILGGLSFSMMLWTAHMRWPNNVTLYYLFSAPFWIALAESIRHGWHIIEQYRKIKPFKYEYKVLSERIKKLSDELKDSK